jgi:hypothetical protein
MFNQLRLLLVIAGLLSALTACCYESKITEAEVPPQVLNLFKSTYPNATDIRYEVEKEIGKKEYEIEFKVDGRKQKVEYEFDGITVKEEQDD